MKSLLILLGTFLLAACQTTTNRSVTDARIQSAEVEYHNLCVMEKEIAASSNYHGGWESRIALLTKQDAFIRKSEDFVTDARVAYAGLSKGERRERLLRLIEKEGYLPAVESVFFWGLTDADLAPYLAARKTQPSPIKL